ncbi:MAG TPA: NAD-dependent malic enzyme [Micromonosporaceae bacterium]|nr:NAD-dependent malic enzyme [Micromonosporaceae bacterium]
MDALVGMARVAEAGVTPEVRVSAPPGSSRGSALLAQPMLNKDAAFTMREREELGLRGLLPWRVASIEEQVTLELEHLRRKSDSLEKYIGMTALQDRNETLFYRVLLDHLEELAPVVYTPTVGEACRQFSHIVRRPRGLWVTPDDIDRIPELLRNVARPGVRLVVATDNERILGLGDQGAGGMGIPIGKLALYTAGAGVHPSLTLPVSLDCGTDNEALLNDPLYLGYPKPRLRGTAYDEFIGAFVEAVRDTYPDAVLQWEDFKQHNAIRLLDRYRQQLPSFNDDIQGTAAVVVAGILAALRLRRERLSDQRIVMVGAGAAGIGIARLLQTVIRAEGGSGDTVHRAVVMLDSHGLVFDGREGIDDDKRPFAMPGRELVRLGFASAGRYDLMRLDIAGVGPYDLETVVRHVCPTILVGTTGAPGAFTEAAIREMAARVRQPIVLPLSNPTAKCEAVPADVLAWTGGRAVVATGSPFDPVPVGDGVRQVGQANNLFVFPGVGLGAIVSRTREVTDRMFLVAATTLAGMIPVARLEQGALYPRLAELRAISRAIAVAVAREAVESGVAQMPPGRRVEEAVDEAMWTPAYAGHPTG